MSAPAAVPGMVHPLMQCLLTQRPVVTDGAWATELQARGLPLDGCPDAWNLAHPDRVEAVARAYVAAGSRVILTNSFGANRFALARHGLEDQAEAINRAGAAISRRATGGNTHVFGSIGPSGMAVAAGAVTRAALSAAFTEQARALAEGGVEVLVIETMTDLEEAVLATEAAHETGLSVITCVTFGPGDSEDRLRSGETPEQAVAALTAAGAAGIGSNCGSDAASLLAVCRRLRRATPLPLWVKPNAGLPEVVNGRAVYRATPAEFADQAMALVEAGADFMGGCCGTGPAHIHALARSFGTAQCSRTPSASV